ncbi:ROK family protein [Rhodococcus sp. AQ5-07]|uniref:ROK family protein n=1 Tax=Rhodococcus sp. AQ5-07 TaxID=2054902 RepID=UPI000DBF457C|nr:ROK family protein [Rhodococcus sp. AQ5-07]RAL30802.1 ROK family protein [Rhodococcus sp. AQ5-07]
MSKNTMTVAGIDVGGTNIGAGLIGDEHQVLDRGKIPTPTGGPDAVMDAIAELVGSLDGRVDAVGVGIPGVVREGEALTVPNLMNWHQRVDIADTLQQRLGVPVALGNDANVGLLGEWLAGAARGVRNVLGIWLGTGVGGGLILDGRPFHGSHGAAGEVGHMIVQRGGALCTCGRRGCVEAYAGRRSMAGVVSAMVDAGRPTSLNDIREDEGKEKLTSKVWARALSEDDDLATELFDMAIETLGAGIGSAVNLLDVEMVVVGGGMAEKLGQDLADRIAVANAPWMLQPNPKLSFVAAALGDDSGLVGAASLGRAALISG